MRRWLKFIFLLLATSIFAYAPAPKVGFTALHQLTVSALHPSGLYVTNATSVFTNNSAQDTASVLRDSAGNITRRIWRSGDGSTNRTQILLWDAKERLIRVTEYDAARNGYLWQADYDALDRRLRTRTYPLTNGVAYIFGVTPKTISAHFDPLVEFLEMGVSVDGVTTWKLYGPDLNGEFGGMNGTGGLEGAVAGLGAMTPTLADAQGNVLGEVTNGVVTWTAARPTGYGAVPGYRPVALGHGGNVAQSGAWRGRAADISGYINLGARYYDPVAGMFLNVDPVWNGRDPNYHTFCGGDPVNYFDADGRFGKGVREGWKESSTEPANSSIAFSLGMAIGGIQGEYFRGLGGGSSITANTLTFGGSDAVGLTESRQYQGTAYTGSRILSTVGRESALAAVTLGTAQAARLGSQGALYSYQGLQVVNAGRSGYAIGTGADQVYHGNNWGYLNIAGGGLGLAGGTALARSASELNLLGAMPRYTGPVPPVLDTVTKATPTVDRIRNVSQQGYNYAVQNPRVQGLNRMQLGKDAEVQATRWLRRWAERNEVNLGPNGLQFQVRGANSVPDVVYAPAGQIFDFKLTPRAVRPTQTQNFGTDFPGYNIEYIFGP